MKFDLVATEKFDRQLKRLAKKRSSLKKRFSRVVSILRSCLKTL